MKKTHFSKSESRIRNSRNESGQAIVLGVFSMFILALTLMMSFNVSQAVYERIRIQQHADSVAYSKAVLKARTFNYIAYTNRSIAAGYAAMATMHAYMASASVMGEMLDAAAWNMFMIGIMELALCCSCGWPWPCCRVNHCIHAWQVWSRCMRNYRRAARDYRRRARRLDEDFQDTVRHLNRLVNVMNRSQLAMMNYTSSEISTNTSSLASQLKNTNAPQSTLSAAVAAANRTAFECAIDISPCPGRAQSTLKTKQQLMAEVAHGTRHPWTARRNMFPFHLHPSFIMDLLNREYQSHGVSLPVSYTGTAKLTDSFSRSQLHDGNIYHGKVVGSREEGWLLSTHRHGLTMIWSFNAEVFTSESGGRHRPSGAHEGTHDQFAGIHNENELFKCRQGSNLAALPGATGEQMTNCFIKFRPDSREFNDSAILGVASHWGQPSVYAAVRQDLSLFDDGTTGPFADQIGDDGVVTFQHGSHGEGRLVLRPEGDGVAVSKAIAYYHRPHDWREQPNFFNPYWRAKLHPFSGPLEYASIVALAGRDDVSDVWPLYNALEW